MNNLVNLGTFRDFSDGSLKTVFDAGNNQIIEITLLMNKKNMDVVCAPTHHFCNLGCKMCHLTNKGLNKNMKAIKTDDFIEALIRSIIIIEPSNFSKENLERRTNKKKLLISFMGVGEPLLNLNLIKDIYEKESYLKDILGYDEISYALATMMPNDNIVKLTEMVNNLNIPLKVHFSMHTPIDEKRYDLIPSTRVSIEEALSALVNYRNIVLENSNISNKYLNFHRTNDPIEIHYTLIDDVNDSDLELGELCNLLNEYKIPIKFIRFNPINELKMSSKEDDWIKYIHEFVPDLRVKTYSPPGREIGSSCGEFTKHYYHQEIETEDQLKEFEEWKIKHQVFNNSWDKGSTLTIRNSHDKYCL